MTEKKGIHPIPARTYLYRARNNIDTSRDPHGTPAFFGKDSNC